MLNLESISVSYGKHKVLSGLDLTIKEGVVAGLLGPNGCGKSTLVRSIAGAQHCHGVVSYGKRSGRALQDVTGYMPQEIPGHIALTAMESVLVSAQRGGSAVAGPEKDVDAPTPPSMRWASASSPTPIWGSAREANGSSSPWRRPSFTDPNWCCSTNRPAPWT